MIGVEGEKMQLGKKDETNDYSNLDMGRKIDIPIIETKEEETETKAEETEEKIEDNKSEEEESGKEKSEESKTEQNNTTKETSEIIYTEYGVNSKEELKSIIKAGKDAQARVTELEAQLENNNKDLELAKEHLNPLHYFNSEEDFLTQQMLKKFPNYNPAVVSKVGNIDVNTLSDVDALVQSTLLEGDIAGGETTVKAVLAEKFGIDNLDDLGEADNVTKGKIQLAARDAKIKLNNLKSDLSVPGEVSFESLRKITEEDKSKQDVIFTENWNPLMERMELKEVPIKDNEGNLLYSYIPNNEEISALKTELQTNLVGERVSPNQDTIKQIYADAQNSLLLQNLPKIIKESNKVAESKVRAEYDKNIHNVKETVGEEAPISEEQQKLQNNAEALVSGLPNKGLW